MTLEQRSTRRRSTDEKTAANGGAESNVTVRRSKIQGRGVFAKRAIAAGERVIEYLGERISHDEADTRYDDEHTERHHTFLFTVDDDIVVDATNWGNEAKYINHSCDPNCEALIEDGRIFIDAIKDIAAGDELLYDYWYTTDDAYTDEDLKRIYPCRCGAATCRGTIAAPRKKKKKVAKKAPAKKAYAKKKADAKKAKTVTRRTR